MKDIFDLTGRVALVTGCSGGLGVQMAKALAARGANLVIIARRYEKLVEVQKAIEAAHGVQVLPLQCDITSTEAVDAMVDEALKQVGHIDIVVNNAGTGAVAPAEDITDAQFENEMQIAVEEKDYAAQSRLQWFIDEQVEEEENAVEIINKLKMLDGNSYGLYVLDQELAARVYAMPSPLAAKA